MKRWCPSCGKAWPAERPACPDCLVELVDDPQATVVCRQCERRCPARMQSCPSCLAELRPDPEAAAEALGALLAAVALLLAAKVRFGRPFPTPVGQAPPPDWDDGSTP